MTRMYKNQSIFLHLAVPLSIARSMVDLSQRHVLHGRVRGTITISFDNKTSEKDKSLPILLISKYYTLVLVDNNAVFQMSFDRINKCILLQNSALLNEIGHRITMRNPCNVLKEEANERLSIAPNKEQHSYRRYSPAQ